MTEAVDLALPTAGFPLRAARRYDSTRAIDGPLGFGWVSNLTPRLYYATYLYAAPSTYLKEAEVTMPTGWTYRYGDSGNGLFTPPNGTNDGLVRNGDGTFDLTLERSNSVYHFDSDGKTLSMRDDYGNTLNYTYDGNGRVQQLADAAGSGRYLNVFWGANGRISSVQDNAGRQIQYTYNTQGALQTVTDAANRVTTYAYNTGRYSPLLARITDTWGRVITDVGYDSSNRVQTYTDAGETYTYSYAFGGNPNVTVKTDSQGNQFTFPFASGGLVTDTTPSAGGPTHTTFYPDGSVHTFTDAVSVMTVYTYTANGSPATITRDASGTSTVRFDYTYDPNFPHQPISITPKNLAGVLNTDWQAWQYDYWQAGDPAPAALRHVYRVQSDGTTRDTLATYTYNSHGQLTQVTSGTSAQTDYMYDAQGNLQTATAPSNNDAGTRPVTAYGYDTLGRVTSVTDPQNHQTTYAYDNLDRITSVTLPKPSIGSSLIFTSTYAYDAFDSPSGLVFTNATDPSGIVTKQGYDQFGQLVKSIDGLNNATAYGYTRGLLASLTDANGNVTTYSYDSGRRLTGTTFPDSTYETYTYTGDNLLSVKTDRKNQPIAYTYDSFKRPWAKWYQGGTGGILYTYVGQKLTQVSDTSLTPNETHTFTYDSSYRVAGNTQAARGTIGYTYDGNDIVVGYVVASGPTTTYAYYPDGSLNTIAWTPVAGQFKYAYTPLGQHQTVTFPNGQTRNFSYDDQGRLTQLSNLLSGGVNLATYAYGYDYNYTAGTYTRLGQRTSLTATVPSQGLNNHLTAYEYDPLYQLTRATYPNVTPFNGEVDSWTYDPIGNRLTNTVNGATQSYTYQKIGANPNNWQRLLSDGASSYTYDANGNTATKTGYAFVWDRDNQMTGMSGGVVAAYYYDYQGRRWGKSLATGTAYFYDGVNLIQELGTSSADYLFGPGIDEPLAMSRSGQVYYYGADALGSVTALTNNAGAVQNTYLYDGWGQTRVQTGSLANTFTYTAREQADAGTLFYRARYYQPSIGRMLGDDPGGSDASWSPELLRLANNVLPGPPVEQERRQALYRTEVPSLVLFRGQNPYSYAFSDPTAFTDPSGRDGVGQWFHWAHWAHIAECAYKNIECNNHVDKDCHCDWNRRQGEFWVQTCLNKGWSCCRGNAYRCILLPWVKPEPCRPLLAPPPQIM